MSLTDSVTDRIASHPRLLGALVASAALLSQIGAAAAIGGVRPGP